MKRQLTEAAKAAQMIRKELKKNGIPAKVKSKNYSMGSSVDIWVTDQLPATVSLIKSYCSRFQYGHFDGMTDMYEYSNHRDDLPQARHVFVNSEYSEEMKQKAWDYLRRYMNGYDELPEVYEQAQNRYTKYGKSVAMEVTRILNGSMDFGFWSRFKKRQKI